VLASILEGVPSLAEDEEATGTSKAQLPPAEVSSPDSPLRPSIAKAIVSPDGSVEDWNVQQQQPAAAQ
jgi:hypothetical protein